MPDENWTESHFVHETVYGERPSGRTEYLVPPIVDRIIEENTDLRITIPTARVIIGEDEEIKAQDLSLSLVNGVWRWDQDAEAYLSHIQADEFASSILAQFGSVRGTTTCSNAPLADLTLRDFEKAKELLDGYVEWRDGSSPPLYTAIGELMKSPFRSGDLWVAGYRWSVQFDQLRKPISKPSHLRAQKGRVQWGKWSSWQDAMDNPNKREEDYVW